MHFPKPSTLAISSIIFLLFIFTAGACAAPADPATEVHDDHHEDGASGEHGHEDDGHDRIPNDGAVIVIVSPEDGASFAAGEDIVVEVEITNFTLNEDGSHWHVYVDGESYGMVVGEVTTNVLRNLEPGEHTITAHLATGDHVELEDGGEVTITVTE